MIFDNYFIFDYDDNDEDFDLNKISFFDIFILVLSFYIINELNFCIQ